MEYNKLVSVTGMGGLYELISSKADGGIVRSLEDKSTKFVSNRLHTFSHLESIEIFTVKDNVNLSEIFAAMKSSDEVKPDSKADAEIIKAYFLKVYPDIDFERVYGSDMKKMLKWFEILSNNNVEIRVSEANGEDNGEVMADKKNTNANKTSASKTTAVKNAPARKINSPRKMA